MSTYRNLQLSKEQILNHLHLAAEAYDRYADRVLLFVYQKNVRSDCELLKVRFGKENFMHLVGIKSKDLSASDFYQSCLDKRIEFKNCTPSHDPSNRNSRILLLPRMTDFSECKIYNIAEKDVYTMQNDFQIAYGNQIGIIGFDFRGIPGSKKIAIPTTLLSRPLSDYCSEPKRILFVYEITDDNKIKTVYEIKKGLYEVLVSDKKMDDIKDFCSGEN